jgi:hypothetical protein
MIAPRLSGVSPCHVAVAGLVGDHDDLLGPADSIADLP